MFTKIIVSPYHHTLLSAKDYIICTGQITLSKIMILI